jgi:hypothetical protein
MSRFSAAGLFHERERAGRVICLSNRREFWDAMVPVTAVA